MTTTTNLPNARTNIVNPPRTFVCMAKGDSAASYNYWRTEDTPALRDIHEDHGPPVGLPDSNNIDGTKAGYLDLSDKLSDDAQRARILPSLKSSSLISLG